jgi:hypothetical protein
MDENDFVSLPSDDQFELQCVSSAWHFGMMNETSSSSLSWRVRSMECRCVIIATLSHLQRREN